MSPLPWKLTAPTMSVRLTVSDPLPASTVPVPVADIDDVVRAADRHVVAGARDADHAQRFVAGAAGDGGMARSGDLVELARELDVLGAERDARAARGVGQDHVILAAAGVDVVVAGTHDDRVVLAAERDRAAVLDVHPIVAGPARDVELRLPAHQRRVALGLADMVARALDEHVDLLRRRLGVGGGVVAGAAHDGGVGEAHRVVRADQGGVHRAGDGQAVVVAFQADEVGGEWPAGHRRILNRAERDQVGVAEQAHDVVAVAERDDAVVGDAEGQDVLVAAGEDVGIAEQERAGAGAECAVVECAVGDQLVTGKGGVHDQKPSGGPVILSGVNNWRLYN